MGKHTLPDGTTKYKMVKVFGQIDSGELAARLGALSVEDRRGNYFWYDTFEAAAINWKQVLTGVGGSIAIDNTYCWMGSQSIKLTTGNADGDVTAISKWLTIPSDYQIGIEVHVKLPDENVEFLLVSYMIEGSRSYYSALRYNPSTYLLEYLDENSAYQTLSTDALPTFDRQLWAMFKLVIDWDTKKYVRAIVGSVQYDLSAHSIYSYATAYRPVFVVTCSFKPKTANNRSCWIDNVIITQNEP